jgi:hypothetical protein
LCTLRRRAPPGGAADLGFDALTQWRPCFQYNGGGGGGGGGGGAGYIVAAAA